MTASGTVMDSGQRSLPEVSQSFEGPGDQDLTQTNNVGIHPDY